MIGGMSISMERKIGEKVTPKIIKFGNSIEVQFSEDEPEPMRIKVARIDGLLGERVHIEGSSPEISVILDDKTKPTFRIMTHDKTIILKVSSEQVEIFSPPGAEKIIPL